MTEDVRGPSCSNPYGRRFQEEGRSRTEALWKNNSSTEVDRYIDDVNKEKEQEQTTYCPQAFIRQEDSVQARRWTRMTSRRSLDKNKTEKRLENRLYLSESNQVEAKKANFKVRKS